MLEYFTLNSKWTTKWKSKGLSDEIEVVSKKDIFQLHQLIITETN